MEASLGEGVPSQSSETCEILVPHHRRHIHLNLDTIFLKKPMRSWEMDAKFNDLDAHLTEAGAALGFSEEAKAVAVREMRRTYKLSATPILDILRIVHDCCVHVDRWYTADLQPDNYEKRGLERALTELKVIYLVFCDMELPQGAPRRTRLF